jgi:hypothetical protein
MALVTAAMVPLLELLRGKLDQSMMAILLQGCAGGALLSWLALRCHSVARRRREASRCRSGPSYGPLGSS